MKFHLSSPCLAILSAFGLASCDLVDGGSGGTQVKEPTVDQMAKLEKEWGVTPPSQGGRSHRAISPGEGEAPISVPPSPAPRNLAPDPVPFPQTTQTAVPPVFEPPPQTATPAQIQKLKN